MKKVKLICIVIFFIGISFTSGCQCWKSKSENYTEIPSVLNILTNNIQLAVEDGYFNNGEASGLEYVKIEYPNNYNWFIERGYRIRVAVVNDYAIVMICDEGKALFEDTYCSGGEPDRDYRKKASCTPCEITITYEDVKNICD